MATSGCIFCDPASFSPSRRSLLPWPPCERGGGRVRGERENAGDVGSQPGRPALSLTLSRGERDPSITAQIDAAVHHLKRRDRSSRFIAYFQPGSNTYGPIDQLRHAYLEALSHPEVVGLAIGTRPDCVGDDVLNLLAELAERTWLLVEYGLQTIHDRTLDRLRRGHHYDAFADAYDRSRKRGLNVGVHVILGLPGETRDDMLATARTLAGLDLHSVKPHNLYAVRNTVLAAQVAAGEVRLPELAEYVGYLVDFLEELPASFVIERLCGDAPPEYLVGPQWCLDKAAVGRAVVAEFHRRGSWQGCRIGS
ncbi:MAG: TIGR01212 family radical SAM protein [Planctomycetaceae bacterium]|nr:TIGR01212 family radical SAM protein [Planctomycetaceae bacterium]